MKVLTTHNGFAPVELASTSFIDGGTDIIGEGRVPLVPGPDGMHKSVSYTQAYRTNPYLWAGVQLKARGMGRMPTKVYRRADDGSKERVQPNPLTVAGSLAYVLRRPGDRRSWQTLQHATMIDKLVHGSGVWFPERDRKGRFTSIRRVPFRYVRAECISGEWRYWDTRDAAKGGQGSRYKRLADDVVHFGLDQDSDDLFPPSNVGAMRVTLSLYDAMERHLVAFFKNQARPSGHVEVDRSTTKVQRQLIRDSIRRMSGGPENAGRVLVTSGKWVPITQTNDHSKIVELIKLSREEIAAVLGIPPPLMGILDRAIMSNVRELRSFYARDVVGPDVALFEGDLDAQLLVPSGSLLAGVFVEVDMNAVLRPDLEARAKTWKDQRYVVSVNEIRRSENLPPIDHPDADVPWMPLAEAPLGADNAPDEPAEPGGGGDNDDAAMYVRPESDET